ncbi:hypothetical protein LCGC14_2957520 [marine sediment metagenome]|uniref:Uncharacterized protein n=1 Tax=marine sediment metagenome TaxID=412755 RepID=A0A0F8ZL09_9ZZZZ
MSKGTDYKVEKKDEVRKLSKGGELETWFRIFATSKGGTYFHVDIIEDQLDNADAILTTRAKKLDAI